MATQNSTLTATGKIGNLVGIKGQNGKTYLRTNTTPTNPNTPAQRTQRTRWALMGRISQLTPAELILGMTGNTALQRRIRFNKNIADNITIANPGTDTIRAAIDETKILFSEGPLTLQPTINIAPETTFNAGILDLTVDINEGAIPSGITPRYIIVALFSNGLDLTDLQYVTVSRGETAKFRTNPLNTIADLYCIPVAINADTRLTSSNYGEAIKDGGTEWMLTSRTTTNTTSAETYCRSQFIAQIEQGATTLPGTEPDAPIEP